jgi:hypothetical protein
MARWNEIGYAIVLLVIVKVVNDKLAFTNGTPFDYLSAPMTRMLTSTYGVVQHLPVVI